MKKIVFLFFLVSTFAFNGCANLENDTKGIFISSPFQYPNDKSQILSLDMDFETFFPTSKAVAALSNRQLLLIHLNPIVWGDSSSILPSDILSGDWDHVLDDLSTKIKNFEYPVILSPLPFSNNSDLPLSIYKWCDNDLDLWSRTHTYIVNRLKRSGAENIIYMWSLSAKLPHPSSDFSSQDILDSVSDCDWIGFDIDSIDSITAASLSSSNFLLQANKPVFLFSSSRLLNDPMRTQFITFLESSLSFVRGVHFSSNLTESDLLGLTKLLESDRFNISIDSIQDVTIMDSK